MDWSVSVPLARGVCERVRCRESFMDAKEAFASKTRWQAGRPALQSKELQSKAFQLFPCFAASERIH